MSNYVYHLRSAKWAFSKSGRCDWTIVATRVYPKMKDEYNLWISIEVTRNSLQNFASGIWGVDWFGGSISDTFYPVANFQSPYFTTDYQRPRIFLIKTFTPTQARRHFAPSFKGIQSNVKMSGRSSVWMLIREQWPFVSFLLGCMSHNCAARYVPSYFEVQVTSCLTIKKKDENF